MKGLSSRLVLAAIILSCGMMQQIGSKAGNAVAQASPFQHKTPRTGRWHASWLPESKPLDFSTIRWYLHRHGAPR